jgi:CRP-like cAMP-binding protein
MVDRTPLDSATALARTPLFSHLGRLDLARLAGELEELVFRPGQVMVREGDPADGFYVIKVGSAHVVPGPETNGHPLTVLGAGDHFGEMALLTHTTRTASVVAHTDITVWRLSRARFEALLGHERTIAQSIERALSQRLAATTHEAGELRAVGRELAHRALAGLSPAARTLLTALQARAAWPAAVLRRVCARTGRTTALAELEALPGCLRGDGPLVCLDPVFAGLAELPTGEPDPAWLAAVAEELRAAGDVAPTLDGAAPAATAPDRPSRPAETEVAARGEAGEKTAGGGILTGPALVVARHGLGAGLAFAIFLLGWLLPEPDGLSRPGLVALGAIVATVPLLVCEVLPDFIVMLLLALALVLPGVVSPAAMLSGFSTPAWIMILTLLGVGTAVARSGLMFRLVLLSLQRLPATFAAQSLALCGAGVLLTAGLTSGSTRIALGIPLARGIADAMGFGPRSPGAAAVGLLTFFSFLQMGELFLTGTFTGLVVHDLLPATARASINWWRWFFVALPTFVIVFGLTYTTILLIFQPHRRARVNMDAIRLQQALLGPITKNEVWSAVALGTLLLGFATRDLHGIPPAWMAVGVFLGLYITGTLDQTALQGGGVLSLLVYSGVILSLANVFATLHIDVWLAGVVQAGMPELVRNPYGFVSVVAAIAFVLHFFVPWMTASTILALVTMPLAAGMGFHPFIPVFVALVAGDHTVVPYVNSGYPIVYFASEGELFSHAQARGPLILEAVYRLLAVLLSVPAWQFVGLM